MNVLGLLAVGGGAAAGAWLRWWLGIVLNPVFPTLPLGTLAANLIGGYLMGIALAVLSHFEALPPEARPEPAPESDEAADPLRGLGL